MDGRPVEKRTYVPSAEKRFEVSSDPISRERLRAVHGAYKEVREQLPGVGIAFTLGGSLAKGKPLTVEVAESADIDLAYFVDTDDLRLRTEELIANNRFFASSYAGALGKIKNSSMGPYLSDEELHDKALFQGAQAVILRSFQTPLSNNKTLEDIREHQFSDYDSKITMRGQYSIRKTVDWMLANRNAGDPHRRLPSEFAVAHRFQLDVGGGMRPYIQEFLRELREDDNADSGLTERYWKAISDTVIARERLSISDEISEKVIKQFPQTYEDACKYYGLQRVGGASQHEVGGVE